MLPKTRLNQLHLSMGVSFCDSVYPVFWVCSDLSSLYIARVYIVVWLL